jgi:hypothetical protein
MMDHAQARAVLDRAKDGQAVSQRMVSDALLATGDRRRVWQPVPKRAPLVQIAPDARLGQAPCRECRLQPGERCGICGAQEPPK